MDGTIYIVEDDDGARRSLVQLFEGIGAQAIACESAMQFFDELKELRHPPRCLLLDIELPDMGGLFVQKELKRRGIPISIVMLSRHAEVPMAVEALQRGALDFHKRPVNPSALTQSVDRALAWDLARSEYRVHQADYRMRLRRLSSREMEVLGLTVRGKNSKQMASELSIGVATILKHKGHMLAKMGVKNDVELVLLVSSVEPPHAGVPLPFEPVIH